MASQLVSTVTVIVDAEGPFDIGGSGGSRGPDAMADHRRSRVYPSQLLADPPPVATPV